MQVISKQNTNEEVKALSSLSTKEKASEDRADNPFQYWVEMTRKALGPKQNGEEYSFGQICGLISKWGDKKQKTRKLEQRYHECKKADIPFAPLWWWKYKNE